MKGNKIVIPLFILLLLLFSSPLTAQQAEENNSFGGWHFIEISHTFNNATKWSCSLYYENDNYQYQRLDCSFVRAKVGYTVKKWGSSFIKLGLGYDFIGFSTTYGHRLVGDITGKIVRSQLSATARLRYLHTWKPEIQAQDNEFRTLLMVAYTFPSKEFETHGKIKERGKIMPYLAVEIFTWADKWRKSRHYVGCMYDITKQMQIEGFYMLTFSNRNPEHILGLGLNFTI